MSYRPQNNKINKVIINLDNVATIQQAHKQLGLLQKDFVQFDAVNTRLLSADLNRLYVEPAILDLKRYPPKPPASKYKRTYKLRKGWEGKVTAEGNRIRALFTNDVPYRRFVQGLIGLGISASSIARYTAPIQKSHLVTGWRPAALILQPYVTQMQDYAQTGSAERVDQMTRKRLSTLKK